MWLEIKKILTVAKRKRVWRTIFSNLLKPLELRADTYSTGQSGCAISPKWRVGITATNDRTT